jgi:dUTP pyrophosphatase
MTGSSVLEMATRMTYKGGMKMYVKKLRDDAVLPQYAHPGDAGLDLFANEDVTLAPGASGMIKTGVAIELPAGTEAQVRPRSGLAAKHALTVLNTPGTVDEGYRGEVCVIMINHGSASFTIDKGMKIAQMVIKPVLRVEVEAVAELSDTARGEGGFGSTGM